MVLGFTLYTRKLCCLSPTLTAREHKGLSSDLVLGTPEGSDPSSFRSPLQLWGSVQANSLLPTSTLSIAIKGAWKSRLTFEATHQMDVATIDF